VSSSMGKVMGLGHGGGASLVLLATSTFLLPVLAAAQGKFRSLGLHCVYDMTWWLAG
jgi:hypothetical protein